VRYSANMKAIIICASSRKTGHSALMASHLARHSSSELIHLSDHYIQHYDYEHRYDDRDEHISIITRIIESRDTIIFVTPVYWYAMSGLLKVFFDRFTDLLETEKDLGRQLRGMNMAVVSSSIGNHLDDQFWIPFRETANYLGMNYLGGLHILNTETSLANVERFWEEITWTAYNQS